MNQKDSGRSDLELITLYREGNQEACTALLARYANYINRRVATVGVAGSDRDDLRQEAYMGLCNAIRTYDPDKGVSFQSYAGACIGNSLKNLFAAASTQKAKLHSQMVSIEDIQEIDLRGKDNANPEHILLDREACDELETLMETVLSDFERAVLFAYLSGCGYTEIAARLDSSPKSVDNALQRARRKLKAVLNNL